MKKIFKGKKITIMGLGLQKGGAGAAEFFCRQGADVLVTDLKSKKQLKASLEKLKKFSGLKFVLGRHRKKDFLKRDLIVRNPAVSNDSPYLAIARKHNIPVKTDIEIFFDLVDSRQIIGITGTKGKSTTAALSYLFLKSKYPNTVLAGNIGVSPLKIFSKINKKKQKLF
jgi:UDP-N-acetylmuramoylalanine--D-glutamate ligase